MAIKKFIINIYQVIADFILNNWGRGGRLRW